MMRNSRSTQFQSVESIDLGVSLTLERAFELPVLFLHRSIPLRLITTTLWVWLREITRLATYVVRVGPVP